jgi:hypothetical protein
MKPGSITQTVSEEFYASYSLYSAAKIQFPDSVSASPGRICWDGIAAARGNEQRTSTGKYGQICGGVNTSNNQLKSNVYFWGYLSSQLAVADKGRAKLDAS